MSIKILQLNIEKGKHIDIEIPFFKKENPDVVCLQEISRATFELLKQELGMDGYYAPMDSLDYIGVAILSRLPIISSGHDYYFRDEQSLLPGERYTEPEDLEWPARVLVHAVIQQEGQQYTVLATHFPKNNIGGVVADFQWRDYQALLNLLSEYSEFILTGDTNCPRGTAIFDDLAVRYTDNIPKEVTTTLDPKLHRAGTKIAYVVDGLFTTAGLHVATIRLIDGVSDHMAIVADIHKVQ